MRVFKDAKDREHQVEINVDSIRQVRDLIGVNLYDLIDDQMSGLTSLMRDPLKLVDVLHVLCCRCRDDCNLDAREFGRGMSGAALAAASEAFVEEYIDFFPDRRVATALRNLMQKSKLATAEMVEEAVDRAESVTVASMVASLREKSGGSPASLESIPARLGSVNSSSWPAVAGR